VLRIPAGAGSDASRLAPTDDMQVPVVGKLRSWLPSNGFKCVVRIERLSHDIPKVLAERDITPDSVEARVESLMRLPGWKPVSLPKQHKTARTAARASKAAMSAQAPDSDGMLSKPQVKIRFKAVSPAGGSAGLGHA